MKPTTFYRKILTTALFFSIIVNTGSCARFRINELEPKIIFTIPAEVSNSTNSNPQTMLLQKNDHVIYGMPVRSLNWKDKMIVSDYQNQQINVYNQNETEPFLIIGKNHLDKRHKEAKIMEGIAFKYSGIIEVSDSEDVFCFAVYKDKIPSQKPKYKVESPPERPIAIGTKPEFNPAEIVCLDQDLESFARDEITTQINAQKLLAIENIFITENKIGILHNVQKSNLWQKNLSIYAKDQEAIHYNLDTIDFLKKEKYKNNHIEIENMELSPYDNSIYINTATYNKKDFGLISKSLYRIATADAAPSELYQTDDPSDFFACSLLNGGFYIKNTSEDGSRVLYKIFDNSGDYIRNVRVSLPDIRASWRETFCTPDAKIYSNRLFRGQYEVYEWN